VAVDAAGRLTGLDMLIDEVRAISWNNVSVKDAITRSSVEVVVSRLIACHTDCEVRTAVITPSLLAWYYLTVCIVGTGVANVGTEIVGDVVDVDTCIERGFQIVLIGHVTLSALLVVEVAEKTASDSTELGSNGRVVSSKPVGEVCW